MKSWIQIVLKRGPRREKEGCYAYVYLFISVWICNVHKQVICHTSHLLRYHTVIRLSGMVTNKFSRATSHRSNRSDGLISNDALTLTSMLIHNRECSIQCLQVGTSKSVIIDIVVCIFDVNSLYSLVNRDLNYDVLIVTVRRWVRFPRTLTFTTWSR